MVKRRFFIENIYAPVSAFFVTSTLLAVGVLQLSSGSFKTDFFGKEQGHFNATGRGQGNRSSAAKQPGGVAPRKAND